MLYTSLLRSLTKKALHYLQLTNLPNYSGAARSSCQSNSISSYSEAVSRNPPPLASLKVQEVDKGSSVFALVVIYQRKIVQFRMRSAKVTTGRWEIVIRHRD